jgi:acyl transferase domain-containing protein
MTNIDHSNTNGDPLEPIAIVGIGLRLPGDADSPAGFWKMLTEGRSAWKEVPPERFNINAYHHPSSARHGTVGHVHFTPFVVLVKF